MVPNTYEIADGNIPLSLADIVSTQIVWNPDDEYHDFLGLQKIVGTQSTINCTIVEVYFNIINEIIAEILLTEKEYKDFNLSQNEITMLEAV